MKVKAILIIALLSLLAISMRLAEDGWWTDNQAKLTPTSTATLRSERSQHAPSLRNADPCPSTGCVAVPPVITPTPEPAGEYPYPGQDDPYPYP